MVEEKGSETKQVEIVEEGEAAAPAGDFVAQIASAAAVIFAFLTFYTDKAGKAIKGYESVYGIIIIIVAGLSFIFASAVLWSKFMKKDSWLMRSPGWAYNTAAGIVIIVSILSMVFAKESYDVNWGVPIIELITGVIIGIGGILKF
ncbi:MAG: hypothetical protein SWK76_08965 [Actinomycetota bacterium]|nr:hypothetical protein [Actinomycetota bacterium]